MIDALLYAVRDGVRAAGFGYDSPVLCEITDPSGNPPTRCGHIFVGIHEIESRNQATRNLDEYFSFGITLTMRVSVPLDQVGNMLLASKLARIAGKNNPSFNARLEQLRAWGHMNWAATVLTNQVPASANDNLANWNPVNNENDIYGFCEPAHFISWERPILVGGDWFNAAPEANDIGLKSTIIFEGARRLQPLTASNAITGGVV